MADSSFLTGNPISRARKHSRSYRAHPPGLDRLPPHDLNAELCVLGSLVLENDLIPEILRILTGREFYRAAYGKVYELIQELHREGTAVDLVTLREKILKVQGLHENLGGEVFLLDMEEAVPNPYHARHYAEIVRAKYFRRKQSEYAIRIFNEAYNEHIDSSKTLEELKECIESAMSSHDDGILEISELYEAIDHLYQNGFDRGTGTGWRSVDEYYTVRPGEMTVMTGIPSHGKSTWQTSLMVNIAREQGWKFAVFSPENQPAARHIAQMMSMYIGKSFNAGQGERMTVAERDHAKEWVNDHFIIINPCHDDLTIDSILSRATACVIKYGIHGMVIDPWNEIHHCRTARMTETEYISIALGKIRRFARTYHVHVWIVAHPTKLPKSIDGRYPVPTPYDISGSAHFNNKADCAVTVWRDTSPDAQTNEVEIHIQKIRFREVGKRGKVVLEYHSPANRYREPTECGVETYRDYCL